MNLFNLGFLFTTLICNKQKSMRLADGWPVPDCTGCMTQCTTAHVVPMPHLTAGQTI